MTTTNEVIWNQTTLKLSVLKVFPVRNCDITILSKQGRVFTQLESISCPMAF